MKLGVIASQNPLVGPNPFPAGTDFYKIYQAWDGTPGSTMPHLVLSNGVDVYGWRADCFSSTDVPGITGNFDSDTPAGTPIQAGWPHPYQIGGLSNPQLTQFYAPTETPPTIVLTPSGYQFQSTLTGGITEHATAGESTNAFGDVIIGIIGAAAVAITAGAIAGATAAGASGATGEGLVGSGAEDATGDLGTSGSVDVTDDAGSDLGTSIDDGSTETGGIEPGTGGTPMDLPPDLTPDVTLPDPVDSVSALTSQDIADAGASLGNVDYTADLQAALDAATSGVSLPSASQVASGASGLSKIIGAAAGAITGSASASGVTSNQFGATSPGTMSVIVLAGFAILLLSGKRK